jgi:hypothetical protein
MSRNEISVNDAFNEYYKLKNKYETNYNKDKQKIIKNKTMSWKEKRNEFKQLKPKCINCLRPVGTIFSTKHSGKPNDDFRELKAICGSLTEPCTLNITINAGVTYNIMDHIKELEKDIENYKNEIIEYKNKLLFGYTKTETAVENFDKIKEAINDTSFLLNINYEHLFDIVDNKTTNESIKKLNEDVYILINQMKQSMKQFDSTGNVQFVRDAIDIYVNQLETKMKTLSELKYKVNLVEFDEFEGVYRLIQKKNGIVDLEDVYVSPEVISFNFGEIYTGKPSAKQNKKKKVPQKLKIVGDDELENDNENEELDKNNSSLVEPIYNADGTVTWNIPEYQDMWNKLPIKYKNALLNDKSWLVKSINNYVQDKKQNKPLKFVTPSNLIVPPQVTEDGTYNFGNKTYNEIFNKYDKSYQNTLLTLYKEENGVRNYDMMIDAINNIIKQELAVNIMLI